MAAPGICPRIDVATSSARHPREDRRGRDPQGFWAASGSKIERKPNSEAHYEIVVDYWLDSIERRPAKSIHSLVDWFLDLPEVDFYKWCWEAYYVWVASYWIDEWRVWEPLAGNPECPPSEYLGKVDIKTDYDPQPPFLEGCDEVMDAMTALVELAIEIQEDEDWFQPLDALLREVKSETANIAKATTETEFERLIRKRVGTENTRRVPKPVD